MAHKTKLESKPVDSETPLSLPGLAGDKLAEFPTAVVRPLRRLATLLIVNGTLPSRLSLTSTLREEGVTYTSLALATILANDTSATVGLVELNWQWPGLARLVVGTIEREASAGEAGATGAGGSRGGMAALVMDGATPDEVLVPTGLPNLKLLPAGELPREGREALVRGSRLREAIDDLGSRFDHLLLDVPAIAATSDAVPLARLGDAILLVVRQGVTPRRVVASALDDLTPCSVLGIVLNRAKVATPAPIFKVIPQE